MRLDAVWHQALSHYASALDEKTLMIRIRTAKNDIKRCDLFYGDRAYCKNPILMFELPMEKVGSDRFFDYYEAEIKSDYTRICYYFKLQNEESEIYYFGGRFKKSPECNRIEYFQFPFIRREEVARVPKWAKEMVMYQIFPDSFASSYKAIDKKSKQFTNKYDLPSLCEQGGTLKGIIDNLDYIADLGINVLYLNPIFTAGQYHKYDIVDYFDIDPCFGDKDTFKALVEACHQRGIRVILDGVFNHSSSDFFAFKDLLEKGEASQYKDWYYDVKFPIEYNDPPNYQAFAYVKEMPKLNTSNKEVVDYFCKVGTYWIEEMGIDGWRLDVANEIDHEFWRQFRNRVRKVKKDAILIGEVWEDSENWLIGDQFDSTMNYRFSTICREFFAENQYNEERFSEEVISMLMRYQKNISYAQMNLLDSHDVPRFLYYCNNDSRKLLLASLFQMTMVGAPSVFYGDEVLISGVDEREYRSPMIWHPNKEEKQATEYFKDIIGLRKSSKAFTEGNYKVILVDNEKHLFMYERSFENEKYLVLLHNDNKSVKAQMALDGQYEEVFSISSSNKQKVTGMLSKELGPYDAIILKQI